MSKEDRFIKIPSGVTPKQNIGITNPDSECHSSAKRPHETLDDQSSLDDAEPKKKIVFGLSKLSKPLQPSSISMKLGSQQKKGQKGSSTSSSITLKPKIGLTAKAFSQHDDDDEEMPPEAKMRMKNIGRETPTSSGPNSFGKSRMGFCDSKKVYERKLKELQDEKDE